jgi:hypothetical protein
MKKLIKNRIQNNGFDKFIIDKNNDLLIADMCECAELLV